MDVKKYLAVAVILLFIGLAFTPSINANVGKGELVEFTTEVCGLNGGKQTVKLTKEEAGEVETLFDTIRERLNATESREEAEEIFKEAVVELDKYGLLGGLSVKQAQRLVTGGYQNSRVIKLLEKLYNRNPTTLGDYENKYCLIAGRTNFTVSYGLIWWILNVPFWIWYDYYFNKYDEIPSYAFFLWLIFCVPGGTISNFNPFSIGHTLAFGCSWFEGYDTGGWVWTQGMNGKWIKETAIYGGLSKIPLWYGAGWWFPGAIGFRGLKIYIPFIPEGGIIQEGGIFNSIFLGSSTLVKLGSEPPPHLP